MKYTLFPSIGFSICALVFLSLVGIMYLSKKKYKNLENNIFAFMLVFTIVLLILEIVCVYTMSIRDEIPKLNEMLCRGYILGSIIWTTSFIAYIWSLGTRNKKVKNKRKRNVILTILLFIIISILFGISCFNSITYSGGSGELYVIAGNAVSVVYVAGFVMVTVLLFFLLKNNLKLPWAQRAPIYFVVVFFAVVTAFQILSGYDFNDLTYIFAFCVTALYFTIESQDNKLINELEKSKEEAIEADKAKTEFLSNMSHEIRTPLNTIMGFSESLLGEDKLTEEVVKRDTKSIHSASVSLLDLVNNILDISRIESGKEEKEEKEYALENLIFDINSVISSKINKESLEFKIDINQNIPSKYYGDSSKIYKIIICVLQNAIKYTNYGSITLKVGGTKDNDMFNFDFTVLNTGHAMKMEDFEKDFNDFVKLGNSTQNNIDSTTLGLIIAKRLVNMLGGEIKFVNEPGKGTQYHVIISQKIISEEKIGNIFEGKDDNETSSSSLINLKGKKILIVDDNKINIKLATRLLESYNFEIDSALSGKECLEKVKNAKYDLIFLDHMMPELDGITTMKLLKESGYNIPPVVALTANSYTGLKGKYLEAGFSDYLSKPISFRELNKLINKFFSEK